MRYASFWVRGGAKIIDLIIIALMSLAFVVVMEEPFKACCGPVFLASSDSKFGFVRVNFIFVLLSFCLFQIGYNAGFVERFGATPGKMLLGLKVVQATGEPLTSWQAFGRACAELLTQGIHPFFYLVALPDGEGRTVYDHMCKTRVIYK